MKIDYKNLKQLLVDPGHVNEKDFEDAHKTAQKEKKYLPNFVVQQGLIKDGQLGMLLADYFKIPFINLRKEKIDKKVSELIPEVVAHSRGVIAFKRGKQGIGVGMIDPGDLEIIHFIEKRTGEEVIPYFITRQDFDQSLYIYKPSLKEAMGDDLELLKKHGVAAEQRDEAIVRVVDALIRYAHRNRASDIHVEPHRKEVVIRFRIDGIMHEVLALLKDLEEFIISRIKVMGKLRTDEHRAAQDGKIRYTFKSEAIDIRVSVVPTTGGENIVMRLLSSRGRQFTLQELGLDQKGFKKVEEVIQYPHGMVLATGPTGSGKTTTLYAILKILNNPEIHISTIEDPVEYDIEGVSQIQVNPKTNLTFAKGLRAIVRQDPDIIMVGEIRDPETAGIAINSALTGHLVLSTLHTNDAASTLPRLLDMGIEPFLVASTVNMAIAQRLVRRLCTRCRRSVGLTTAEKTVIKSQKELINIFKAKGHTDIDRIILFKGVGCEVCGHTGYAGRVGIFELLEMQDNIKELILQRASSYDINKVAVGENGMQTMLEDGIQKTLEGATSLQEVFRVTRV